MIRPVEQTHGKYLGYGLLIRERSVTVTRPDGRLVGVAYSISGARRLVRGYRRTR